MFSVFINAIILNEISEYTKKYNVHKDKDLMILAIIHLIWLIEEYAIIFRKLIWFNPLILPIIDDDTIEKNNKG